MPGVALQQPPLRKQARTLVAPHCSGGAGGVVVAVEQLLSGEADRLQLGLAFLSIRKRYQPRT